MLTTYLRKNEHTIIDYERRKLAGKTIGSGSGRTEKQNDILVAKRQNIMACRGLQKGH